VDSERVRARYVSRNRNVFSFWVSNGQMLSAQFHPMLRKIVVGVVVLLVAGVVPATALIGFCAQMPCCFGGTAQPEPALASNMGDCCSTINCTEPPSRDLNANAMAKSPSETQVVTYATIPAVQLGEDIRAAVADNSPPPTTLARLVSLSTFRI